MNRKEIEGKDHEISSLRGDLAAKSHESDANGHKLKSATDQLSEKTSKIAELESQLADLSASGLDAVDGYKKQMSDLKQQLDLAREKLGEKDSKISSLEVDIVPLLKYDRFHEATCLDYVIFCFPFFRCLGGFFLLFPIFRKEIETKGQELAVLTEKLNESTRLAESYSQEVKQAGLHLVEKDAKISELETKLADLSASASAESNAVQDLKKQLSESQSELAGKDSKISSLTSDVIPSLRYDIPFRKPLNRTRLCGFVFCFCFNNNNFLLPQKRNC
jgi:chromosome segregation ATPase